MRRTVGTTTTHLDLNTGWTQPTSKGLKTTYLLYDFGLRLTPHRLPRLDGGHHGVDTHGHPGGKKAGKVDKGTLKTHFTLTKFNFREAPVISIIGNRGWTGTWPFLAINWEGSWRKFGWHWHFNQGFTGWGLAIQPHWHKAPFSGTSRQLRKQLPASTVQLFASKPATLKCIFIPMGPGLAQALVSQQLSGRQRNGWQG